jgi:hypothetical protein
MLMFVAMVIWFRDEMPFERITFNSENREDVEERMCEYMHESFKTGSAHGDMADLEYSTPSVRGVKWRHNGHEYHIVGSIESIFI